MGSYLYSLLCFGKAISRPFPLKDACFGPGHQHISKSHDLLEHLKDAAKIIASLNFYSHCLQSLFGSNYQEDICCHVSEEFTLAKVLAFYFSMFLV